jgi:L-2-hydroxyglutarate oxidase LhgO
MIRSLPFHYAHVQTAIIGAGVIGLSVARSLSKVGHEVLILEQSNTIGAGISSRNSEVIHAGIYYDKVTMPLKSRLCVEGKRLLYDYCQESFIPYRQCGKILVATDADERDFGLPSLLDTAKRNGVHDLKILSREEIIAEHEPNVTCTGGVLSPSTGIVDSHALMTSLLADAQEYGATLALHCQVNGGRTIPSASKEIGNLMLFVDESEIACDHVVVCAGLATDKIATAILSSSCSTVNGNGSTNHVQIPKQFYAKGNYYKLQNQKSPFTKLVYPLPDKKGGLGVHATIDLANSTRFGPDTEWLDLATDRPDEIDMNVDPSRAKSFYAAVRKYWPDLQGK